MSALYLVLWFQGGWEERKVWCRVRSKGILTIPVILENTAMVGSADSEIGW